MAEARWAEAGGIAGLYRLLEEHGEAIEADLQRYYGRALSDVLTGRMTWRQLRVYVSNLPTDSATVRELSPDAEWSLESLLLATAVDELRAQAWQFRLAHVKRKGDAGPEPKPIPRPGVKADGNRFGGASMPLDEVKSWTAAMSAA